MQYSLAGNGLLSYINPWGCGRLFFKKPKKHREGNRWMTNPVGLLNREKL